MLLPLLTYLCCPDSTPVTTCQSSTRLAVTRNVNSPSQAPRPSPRKSQDCRYQNFIPVSVTMLLSAMLYDIVQYSLLVNWRLTSPTYLLQRVGDSYSWRSEATICFPHTIAWLGKYRQLGTSSKSISMGYSGIQRIWLGNLSIQSFSELVKAALGSTQTRVTSLRRVSSKRNFGRGKRGRFN